MSPAMLLASLLLSSLSPTTQPQSTVPPLRQQSPDQIMVETIERYAADRALLGRLFDVRFSPQRSARMAAFYEEWRQALAGLDFEALGQAGRVDWLLLRNRLEYETRRVDLEAQRLVEMTDYLPFLDEVLRLVEARRRMEPADPELSAQALVRIAESVEATQAALAERPEDAEPLPRTVANRAGKAVKELRRALRNWHGYYAGYDPLFSWWNKAPHRRADKALEEYADWVLEHLAQVDEDDPDTIIGDPIGRAGLLSELEYEMIPYTPEELIAIGEQEYAWCEAELLRASQELGFGDDWHAALEHTKGQYVAPGEQPALIRSQALEIIDYLRARDLVTIPELCVETWRMEMLSPERQKQSPFFLGGETIQVSFPTDSMAHEDKLMSLRSNNIHFCRATVHHELIPGHHLQGYMAARYAKHRAPFRTPFFVEGWALWWELYLWDLGFATSAENRMGMLFWRTHRCARIITSLAFHLGTMTTDEMIEFLVDKVGHERSSAEAEVRRWVSGGYGALYQCAYLLGGLQLRGLHRELVESGTLTDREFHDALLRENSIPVELIRAQLTSTPLQSSSRSSWRFYEQN